MSSFNTVEELQEAREKAQDLYAEILVYPPEGEWWARNQTLDKLNDSMLARNQHWKIHHLTKILIQMDNAGVNIKELFEGKKALPAPNKRPRTPLVDAATHHFGKRLTKEKNKESNYRLYLRPEIYDSAMAGLREIELLAGISRPRGFRNNKKTIEMLIKNKYYQEENKPTLAKIFENISNYHLKLNPNTIFYGAHQSFQEDENNAEFHEHIKNELNEETEKIEGNHDQFNQSIIHELNKLTKTNEPQNNEPKPLKPVENNILDTDKQLSLF